MRKSERVEKKSESDLILFLRRIKSVLQKVTLKIFSNIPMFTVNIIGLIRAVCYFALTHF